MTPIGNTQNEYLIDLSLLSPKEGNVLKMRNEGNDWEGDIKIVLFQVC